MAIKKDIGAYSAYAIAVKHGYVGTEAQWVAAQEKARIDSEAAADAAKAAQEAAEKARDQAQTAKGGAENAQQAAGQAAQAAQDAATKATQEAQAAQTAREGAEAAKGGAETAKTGAETAQTEAGKAKTAAEEAAKQAKEALTGAQEAKTGAVEAQGKAEEAAQGVAADREQIGANKTGLEQTREELTATKEELSSTKTALATTQADLAKAQRAIKLQAKLTQGQVWDFEEDDQTAYQRTVPSGAHAGAVVEYGGKTVAWNQVISNRDSGIRTITGPTYMSDIAPGDVALSTIVQPLTSNGFRFSEAIPESHDLVSRHTYILLGDIKYTTAAPKTVVRFQYLAISDDTTKELNVTQNWQHMAFIAKMTQTIHTANLYVDVNSVLAAGDTVELKNVQLVDLTLLYGTGNEPTTTDDPRIAQIEAYAAKHPEYNGGELVSAAVDEVRVKGKNLLNANIDGYAINIDTGLPNKDSRMSVTDFIPVVPMDTYGMFSNFGNLGKLNVACYDSAKFYTGKYPVTNLRGFKSFVVPTGTRYVRCCILTTEKKASYLIRGVSAGTAADYSPYKLETFQLPAAVRSLLGYGWSAGNVANTVERTENGWQYVQRVGSRAYQEGDELTDGTTTYYALATPITTDITALMGDSLAPFSAEAGGSITMHHPKADEGLAIDVPAKIQYITKLSEVSANG